MLDIRIAVVQMRSRVGDPEGNLARTRRLLLKARERHVDIVCFPELSLSGYSTNDPALPDPQPMDAPFLEQVAGLGRESGLWFLVGLLERGTNGVVYNTQVVAGPGGIVGSYRKTRCPAGSSGPYRSTRWTTSSTQSGP